MTETRRTEFPAGWGALDADEAAECTRQLALELGPDDPFSPFFEIGAIRAIGSSTTSHHVVYEIDDWEAPYFVSKLSWEEPDRRPALLQWLRPIDRPDPGVVPISNFGQLDGWRD
ncbi:MAG: hypothetical protein KDK53_22790 [Maritimibacter sp.]|nr:hypothetical protein [Maritimibacter sp.]